MGGGVRHHSSKLRNALGLLTHFIVYGKSALKHISHAGYDAPTNLDVYINIYPLTAWMLTCLNSADKCMLVLQYLTIQYC